MSYPLILSTLRQFDLITDEELIEAYCEYQRGFDQAQAIQDIFKVKWLAARAAKPWWRRWFISKEGWWMEWFDLPLEERYPSTEDEKRIWALVENACE